MVYGIAFVAVALAAQAAAQVVDAKAKDYTQYVNVFRGTTNGGNMFPGVVPAPFSVVKLGPDLYTGSDSYSGYQPTGNITGFSMMHESGTGGAPKYGVVSQMPVSGPLNITEVQLASPRGAPDNGSVGYYSSTLTSGVKVELAGTDHAGFFQYSFPAAAEKHVVIDVGHFLPSFRGLGWSQYYLGGKIGVGSDGHYQGYGSYDGGWNRGKICFFVYSTTTLTLPLPPKWTIYFCGKFDQPIINAYTFKGNESLLSQHDHSNNSASNAQVVGAVFSFNSTNVTSRVGISWISAAKACDFIDEEIPAGSTLDGLVQASKQAWNQQVFSKIQTTNTVTSNLQQLYSNLYGMYIIPTNKTGENPKWPAAARNDTYYDDIFTLWDLHRCSLALTQLITPTAHTEQMASLVNIYKHEGWMPDARSSNANGETQGGSNADNVLADAYVKGVNIDWNTAYQAMKKDASVTPPNNQDPRAPDSSTLEGRGALEDWLQYGYITLNNFSRSVSRGIEYAANDFAVFQVADGLDKNNAHTYLNRSRNWRNYFNPAQTSTIGNESYTGFLVPKYANGSFEYPYDPTQCGGCYWKDPYYEALPWEYLFSSRNHDIAHLITLLGGPAAFVSRLETLMAFNQYSGNSQFNNTLINPGNEPSFNTPYLFNFAPNAQHRTVYHSRQINTLYYNEGTGGIPGNSDAGAMQTYQLWNMIGLYPMVSTTTFLISAPWFDSMTINLDDTLPSTSTTTVTDAKNMARTLKITATGLPADVKQIVYVQSLKVNGIAWDKAWLSWSDIFENGGTMEFVMGPNVVDWATGDLPPSPAS